MFDNQNWNQNMRHAYDPLYMGYRLPKYEVVKVNGEAGAKGFQMAPNSSIILADMTDANRLWLATTDGGGYLTVTPLDVTIHVDKPQVSLNTIEERLTRLEEMYDRLNSGLASKSKKPKQPATTTEPSTDSAS